MEYQFTAAAQRALIEAAKWSTCAGADQLDPPAVLVGLLAEPECRAAMMLARCGIDAAAVHHQWPSLERAEDTASSGTGPAMGNEAVCGSWRFSEQMEMSLSVAADRLADYSRPLELATEHVLLGLAAARHEVSAWLRRQGIDPEAMETEVRRLYGHAPDRLPLEGPLEDSAIDPAPLEVDEPVCGVRESPLSQELSVLRVFDAAANRAREGLRVVEDHVRFVLDDPHLTGLFKQLRHDLTAAVARIPAERRLAARETRADVGTGLATAAERSRSHAADVLGANFTRLQEALRSLEEFGKVIEPSLAAELEQIRYRSYTLQRAVGITRSSARRLARARLYALIDGRPSPEEFDSLVQSLIETGIHMIQLRDKRLDDRRLLARARRLRQLTDQTDTLLIINDRPDLAALARADGVHVGQEEVSVKDARSIVGLDALVGVSTHSIEQSRAAVLDGANYIGVGPTFHSGTKTFDEFPGIELLRAVAAEIRLPAFAIGGITQENLPEVLATGLHRIAVSGALTEAADPAAAARQLSDLLEDVGE